jgi:MFS family permease
MIEFLGLQRNIVVLLGTIFVASLGERLWISFAPKYLETLGAGALFIGLFDGLQTILGAVYAYPGAWMTDRYGQRKSLLLFSGCALIGYLIVYFWQSPMALIFGVFFFLAWSALSLPATFSMVATNLKREKYTMGIGVQSFIRRIPMMAAPLLGGWLVSSKGWRDGIHEALLLCIALSLVGIILQFFMGEPRVTRALNGEEKSLTFIQTFNAFPKPLKELLSSDIMIRFCERIPYAFVILWAIDNGKVSGAEYGILIAVEMLTAMLCYIPVANLADKYGRKPFILATFIFFTLFPITLLLARSMRALIFAFVIRGFKEFGEPARKALIISYAPAQLKAKAYGVYYLIRDCVVTLGSFLGAFLWRISPRANFFCHI